MKNGIMIICVAAAIAITSCAQKTSADYVNYTSVDGEGFRTVVAEDKVFIPVSAVANTDRGNQIGIVDGDAKDKIFEYKGHNPDEWIIEYYDSGEMDGSMLYREKNVDDWDIDETVALGQGTDEGSAAFISESSDNENSASNVTISAFYTPDEAFLLSADEADFIQEIIDNGTWNEEGTTDGLSDSIIVINDTKIYYNSANGVLDDVINDRFYIVDDDTKERLNDVLESYIKLGGFD